MSCRTLIAAALLAGCIIPCKGQTAADLEFLTNAKSGVRFNGTPVIAYFSDLGLELGGSATLTDYGTSPSLYPDFKYKIDIDALWFTKGQTMFRAGFESGHIIPGVLMKAGADCSISPLFNFYGMNGLASYYDISLDRRGSSAAYCMKRNRIRMQVSLRGKITEHLYWTGALSFRKFTIGNIDDGRYDRSGTLYNAYVQSGFIPSDEASGGAVAGISAGLTLDSRDSESDPRKGVCAGIAAKGASWSGGNAYLQLTARISNYLTPGFDWMTLAWQLSWQGRLSGRIPFFMLEDVCSDTIRGVMYGRLLGCGYGVGNFEMRFRVAEWRKGFQKFSFSVNPFFDADLITEAYRPEAMAQMKATTVEEVIKEASAVHCSAGIGLKFWVGGNCATSLEFAKAFRNQDGPFGISAGVSYLF